MSKPEWTKIGTVEVCVGTDGVTGVSTLLGCYAVYADGVVQWCDDKQSFEARYCQPPKPRHVIRQYADGSCVVESTEQDEQGRPLRCAIVMADSQGRWSVFFTGNWDVGSDKQDAIKNAVRYVETGE